MCRTPSPQKVMLKSLNPEYDRSMTALPTLLTFALSSVSEQFGSFRRRGLMPKRVKVTHESDSLADGTTDG